MGLDVDVLGAEELLRRLNCECLDLVDHLTGAAVVAAAGISLGVLVREQGAERLEDRRAGEVLRSDQLESLRLPPVLLANEIRNLRILTIKSPKRHRRDGSSQLRNATAYPDRSGGGPSSSGAVITPSRSTCGSGP